MFYKCLRCGSEQELRNTGSVSNPLARYKKSEEKINLSNMVVLARRTGLRNLCPQCLKSLIYWLDKSN